MADWEVIKRSIASVTAEIGGEVSEGTGFYIGEGFVLTALHVVADTSAKPVVLPSRITLTFGDGPPIKASLAEGLWDAVSDWAALRCEVAPDVPPLQPVTTVAQDARWWAYGFPAIHAEGKTVKGDVRDPNVTDEGARAIELFCEDVSGQGPPLHGLSGAPCLIDGKVAGVLRATLTDAVFDGKRIRRLYVQAGTIYATPASAIVTFQLASRASKLPRTWAPPGTSKEFVTYVSSAAAASKPARQLTLESVAIKAHQLLQRGQIAPPEFISWENVFASRDAFLETIPILCTARVVIFDATDFEPAIMLLAGIRAVVRRGITILSVGSDYALGDALRVPFNVTDANIVSHSNDQARRGVQPVAMLADRLRQGLKEVELSTYEDNPVYESIRRLPADRRGLIPREDGVLVLCAFKHPYNTEIWAERLSPGLEQELERLNEGKPLRPGALGVARSFELNSARLVSQALYETIRRAQACVVDLTHWSPNVLFELGVRLAASREHTSCLLANNWEPPRRREGEEPSEAIRRQCERIAALFVNDPDGRYDPGLAWTIDPAYGKAYGPDWAAPFGLADGSVHKAITAALDVDAEPASKPVYRELMDVATLFGKAEGNSKPVGLYPGNPALTEREESAEFGRLMAAWLHVYFRPWDPAQALDDVDQAAQQISITLSARHKARIEQIREGASQELRKALDAVLRPRQPGVKPGAAPTSVLDDIGQLKKQATALRNLGDFEGSLKVLNDVIRQLSAADSRGDDDTSRQIQMEIADAHGMKGGVYRRYTSRPDHLDLALEAYQEGCRIERVLEHSTYNSSNVITLAITHQKKPLDAELRADLNRVIASLERETQGPRSDEFWAWADLAQFYLLRGDADRAKDAYRSALDRGPTAAELGRHIQILRELAEGIRGTAPGTAAAVTAAAAQLQQGAAR